MRIVDGLPKSLKKAFERKDIAGAKGEQIPVKASEPETQGIR